MTLAYKLFGIPRNIDEFIDAAKKQGQESMHVSLINDWHQGNMANPKSYYSIYANTSDKKRLVARYTPDENTRKERIVARVDALNSVIQTAEKIQKQGLEVTVSNTPYLADTRFPSALSFLLDEIMKSKNHLSIIVSWPRTVYA